MSTITSHIPQLITNYFEGETETPKISQVFRPGGWTTLKDAVPATWDNIWAEKDRKSYVIGVQVGNRVADFRVVELERFARQPLFGGSLV